MANFNQAANRPFSLRLNLVLLVLACVLPAAMVSALLLYANFHLEKTNVEHQTALVAKSVVSDLDRDLAAVESALKTLATSQELASGNLAGFHARASQALASGIVYNYVLTDPAGQQVLNTLQPYGAALPSRGTPTQLAAVFTLGSTVLTDMFTGPVTGKPAIAMGVPVVVNGEVKYSLNIGLSPDRIQDMVVRHALPEGWLMAVLDSNGTIVGRSRDVDRFLGQKAVPELAAALAQGAPATCTPSPRKAFRCSPHTPHHTGGAGVSRLGRQPRYCRKTCSPACGRWGQVCCLRSGWGSGLPARWC